MIISFWLFSFGVNVEVEKGTKSPLIAEMVVAFSQQDLG